MNSSYILKKNICKRAIVLFVFALTNFHCFAQNTSPSHAADTNIFFVSNTYHCVCQYDATLYFDVHIKRKLAVMNSVNYLNFEIEHSKYGLVESIYLRKIGNAYYITGKNKYAIEQNILFSFEEKMDDVVHFNTATLFGGFKTRIANRSSDVAFTYKLESYDTEICHFSMIEFDRNYNISRFEYYFGYNYDCKGVDPKR